MSHHTISALQRQGISTSGYLRLPVQATQEDFSSNDLIIAVKEAEHRPMIRDGFPNWLSKVDFWHVHDLDCSSPEEAIAQLDLEVAALLERLTGR